MFNDVGGIIKPEAVSYEDGEHCVFYALQAANIHFNNQPLTTEYRDRLQTIRKDTKLFYQVNEIPGLEEKEKVGYIVLTLPLLIPELGKLGITIDSLFCSEETKVMLEKLEVVSNLRTQINIVDTVADVPFPFICFVEHVSEPLNTTHIWFAGSEQDFNAGHPKHISRNGRVTLLTHLSKITNQTNTSEV